MPSSMNGSKFSIPVNNNPRTEKPPDVTGKVAAEIDNINNIVIKYFPVSDIRIGHNALVFRIKISEKNLDEKFISLKDELFKYNYIPMLTTEKEDYILLVTKRPFAKYRSVIVNIIMLILTMFTTILAGAWSYAMFDGKTTIKTEDIGKTWTIFMDPHYLLMGAITFALPLMLILGLHELGHYLMSRRHHVSASLPFFIPLPPYPVSPLGTMGAFISVREPIPNKKALLDIGIAGPICGFIVALPVTILGLFLTVRYAHPAPADVTYYFIPGDSILYIVIGWLFPGSGSYMIHPIAFAGWVGFLVTSINLLPVGQLDGGHIAQALLGEKAKFLGYGAIGFMLVIGLYAPSWLFFAFFVILLGIRHPPPLNNITFLDTKRKVVGIFAITLLIICFVPSPLSVQEAKYDLSIGKMTGELNNKTVIVNSSIGLNYVSTEFNFTIKNTGNTVENFTVTGVVPLEFPPLDYRIYSYGKNNGTREMKFDLDVSASKNLTIVVFIPNNKTFANKSYIVTIDAKANGFSKEFRFTIDVEYKSQFLISTKMPRESPVNPNFVYLF